MQYFAPFGSTDPNASYVNGDPLNGVPGSIPDARGFEATQREIVNAIAAAGLTPSSSGATLAAADLTQLVQALRSGILTYTPDLSTAANTIILAPAFAYTSLKIGTVFRFKATFAPTGDTLCQVNNLASIGVRMPDGSKVTTGAWSAGQMVSLEYDGSYLQFKGGSGAGGLVRTSNVVLQVPSALYPTMQSAVIAAHTMILPPNVGGIISVAAGYVEYLTSTTGPIYLSAPFGERWQIVGAPVLGSIPTAAQLAGKTNAQVLTLLRTIFQVEVRCVGTSAFELHSGVWNQIANILVTGDQTNSGGRYGIKVGDWSTRVGMGALGLLNVAVHGFGLDNIRAELLSAIQAINVCSTYSSAHAFHISHGSVLECNAGNLLAMFSQTGVALQNGGQLAVDSASGTIDISSNTGPGLAALQGGIGNLYPATGVRIQNNGTYGIVMAALCAITLPSGGTTVLGNGLGDILLNQICQAITYGCSLPNGSSPARGTTGNQGCTVY